MPFRSAPPVTWTEKAMSDQSGRLVVVTGANGGIGYATARELARRGAHVVMACRNAERGRAALGRLRAEVPDSRAELRPLDLSVPQSVREFADAWDHDRLDVLINNAGVVMVPESTTVAGHESHFGTNHLGTFMLTGLLLPHLLASGDPRVVTVSSETHITTRFPLDRIINGENRGRYSATAAYGISKKANVYFAMHLHRLAVTAGVSLRSMIAIPGMTDTHGMARQNRERRNRLWEAVVPGVISMLAKPVIQGAWPTLYAATVPGLPGGSYIAPRGPLQQRGGPAPRNGFRAVRDTRTAARLWEYSEKLTGVSYEFPPPVPPGTSA
ncbi:oxidoreductase [Streptomyces sp. ACA25]|uniref:oxidoreductase n=1 Tax=Streptomyces sp. ACA25 TaxID=3022596 RepID=UPI0023071007|nr:oxidoreductase [Streptomyces sp. ACA25]MDB1086788.1 oxidoreductase [Streptomyces sp. ACA25]